MTNRCEICTRRFGLSEIVHGICFGVIDNSTGEYLPLRESSPTLLCSRCGSLVLQTVYAKLKKTITNPNSTKGAIP